MSLTAISEINSYSSGRSQN